MMQRRRSTVAALALALALALAVATGLLGACAGPPSGPTAPLASRSSQTLAPTGKLRVGVYLGSPTSLVKDASGEARGVTVDLGKEFAMRLGVPLEQVEFARLALVLDALKAGQVDFTVTNATPARAQDMNFSAPLIELELGYLVLPGARVTSIADVDRVGVRVGVSQGSSSQAALLRALKNAAVLAAPSLKAAGDMLVRGEIDTFATNKAILFELADSLPSATVLAGRWGVEHLAIAIPKGREAAMDDVRTFAEEAKASGSVRRAVERAGLRGTAETGSR